jgi:hypothetical protein
MSTNQDQRKNYHTINGITAELEGALRYSGERIFDYSISPKSSVESIESRGTGEFIAGILDDLDSSRDCYGATNWRGKATEKDSKADLQIVVEYSSVVELSELPPRAPFVNNDDWSDDPYDVFTAPLEIMISGETDIRYENASTLV